jgi:hypothetical protein
VADDPADDVGNGEEDEDREPKEVAVVDDLMNNNFEVGLFWLRR